MPESPGGYRAHRARNRASSRCDQNCRPRHRSRAGRGTQRRRGDCLWHTGNDRRLQTILHGSIPSEASVTLVFVAAFSASSARSALVIETDLPTGLAPLGATHIDMSLLTELAITAWPVPINI